MAYPSSYISRGRLVFNLNDAGTMFKRDPLPQAGYVSTMPTAGVAGTAGVMTANAYDTFPFDPNGSGSTQAAGPWSKLD